MSDEKLPAAGWDEAAVARALHAVDCAEADRDRSLDKLPPVNKWADPWLPCGKHQLNALMRRAKIFLKALRHNAPPDSGAGKSASNAWRSISEDTSWLDGCDVVLLAHDMEVQARYCPGEWADETPSSPREYSGAVWSCFDDQFQLEIEECSEDPSEWGHDGATHWRPISALSNPAPVAANASGGASNDPVLLRHLLKLANENVERLMDEKAANASAEAYDLTNDEFRHEYMMDQVRSYIAFQIRALREQPGRRWSQAELAERSGKTQSVISRLEDPDYGKLSLQSLLEIAIAFDIPLLVQFVEWDDWLGRMSNMSPSALRKKSFDANRLLEARQRIDRSQRSEG